MKKNILILLLFVGQFAWAEAWDSESDPANMDPHYHYQFSQLPLSGRIDDSHMPWSDNYWESDWGGISFRWHRYTIDQLYSSSGLKVDKTSFFEYVPPTRAQVLSMSKAELAKLSPAEKYDILMGRYDYPTVKSERERTSPDMMGWQGICHGWVPAAINHPEPLPTEVKNADGVVVPFGSSDIKGLLSYYYGVAAYDYARGAREVMKLGAHLQVFDSLDAYDLPHWLNLSPAVLLSDSDGNAIDPALLKDSSRVNVQIDSLSLVSQVGDREDIREPNAGAFHVVMANQLGLMNRAFAGNINKYPEDNQIWNQPLVGYSTVLHSNRKHRDGTSEVKVTTTLTFVAEIPQSWKPVLGTTGERFAEMVFSYTLDLDASGNIVGGKWANRTDHPGFLWKHDPLQIKGYWSKLNRMNHSNCPLRVRTDGFLMCKST